MHKGWHFQNLQPLHRPHMATGPTIPSIPLPSYQNSQAAPTWLLTLFPPASPGVPPTSPNDPRGWTYGRTNFALRTSITRATSETLCLGEKREWVSAQGWRDQEG